MSGPRPAAVIAALDGVDALVLAAHVPITLCIDQIRKSAAPVIVLLIGPEIPPVEHAMLIAAIGPLAIEVAPATRLCALDILHDADLADVIAAARFLTSAESTTGQVLQIGG